MGNSKDTLSVVDNRTGQSFELPIANGTIRAADLRQIKTGEDDFGLMSYDPGFKNTASVRSEITRSPCRSNSMRGSGAARCREGGLRAVLTALRGP